jgi:hypothetical protein
MARSIERLHSVRRLTRAPHAPYQLRPFYCTLCQLHTHVRALIYTLDPFDESTPPHPRGIRNPTHPTGLRLLHDRFTLAVWQKNDSAMAYRHPTYNLYDL